ncbi:MAG: hypothetical protein U5J63_02085 [Fodinibius sp.]|nr:hypothetical protein [Fodinibius sp.]
MRKSLKHVAGVGSSPVVSYEGTGAYFLDKVQDGIWRLEVMPDAVHVKDPFAVVALDKRLTWIDWQTHAMDISVPGLGEQFQLRGINAGNGRVATASEGSFEVYPGTYLLVASGRDVSQVAMDKKMDNYRLNEYVAPPATDDQPVVRHEADNVITADEGHTVSATVAGQHPSDSVKLVVQSGWQSRGIPMNKVDAYNYEAEIPADNISTGFLTYWIVVEQDGQTLTFPGGFEGHPGDWDYHHQQQYRSKVVAANAPVTLFKASEHSGDIAYAFQFWDSNSEMSTISTDSPGGMAVQISAPEVPSDSLQELGWSVYVGDAMESRGKSLDTF